jgi:hypothetical protein
MSQQQAPPVQAPVDLDEIQQRIGLLDHDLTNADSAIKAQAETIAGWYVHDCDRLVANLRDAYALIAVLFERSDAAADDQLLAAYEQARGGAA